MSAMSPVRAVLLASAIALPGACSNRGLLDPAPFDPSRAPAAAEASGTAAGEAPDPLRFATLAEAARRLVQLSNAYADQRDRLLREQTGLDLLMLGTTAAAVVNPLFDGARQSTLALGLSAGGLAAGRTYLGGSARAAAYQAGSATLSCAAGIAEELQGAEAGTQAMLLDTQLGELIGAAARSGGAEAGTLRAARERAERARQDLAAAIATLRAAPIRLQAFARAAIRGTTARVLNGSMNLDAALTAIRSLAPAPAAAPGPGAAPASASALVRGGTPRTAAELAVALDAAAAEAARFSASVTEVWSRLPICGLQP